MKKILVIEDRQYVLDNILKILKRKEFDVKGVKDGRAGIKTACEYQPDLIVCDVLMPDIDGYRVLMEIRKNPTTELTPFIFLTALSEKDDIRKGMNLGADDYITKPFTKGELLDTIGARLEKQDTITKKINKIPKNLVSTLPHEINTPLNGIIGFSDLISQYYKTMEREEIGEMSKYINTSGKRLHRVIENFLLYTQLEIFKNDSEKTNEIKNRIIDNPKDLISEISYKKAEEHNRKKDLELNLVNARIKISPNDLKKIIDEIIGNAFKFSKAGTAIKISSELINSEFYIIKIIDSGKGMTQDQIKNIDTFSNSEYKFKEPEYSGLGLIISKKIIELYDGKLNVFSIPNEKTIITIILTVASM